MRSRFVRWWPSRPRSTARRPGRIPPKLELLEDRLTPATITVTTTADEAAIDGQVSLREAINSINAGMDTSDVVADVTNPYGTNDTILFNIPQANPASPQPQIIQVGSTGLGALPQLLKPVLIDGTTEPGFNGKPLVVVNGANAGANANGFDIELAANGPFPTGVTIKALVINGFSANGVLIGADLGSNAGNPDNTIQGCYIGTNPTGTTAVPNGANGVFIDGIDGNNVGGFASNNRITGNVISGNAGDGVLIQANSNGLAAGNVVTGNFIGTDVTGTAALPNGQLGSSAENGNSGVEIVSASGNSVGGTVAPALTTTAGAGNVISGNAVDGVHVIGTLTDPATVNLVEGNYVGVSSSGVKGLGNARFGIEVSGANKDAIGGNVVGANAAGIEVDNGGQNNVIQGNFSGVGADGVTPVGNKLHGIVLRSNDAAAPPLGPGQPNEPGVQNNLVGGTGPGQGNTVAFNGTAGIAVFGNPVSTSGQPNVGNTIEGNSVYQNGRSSPGSLLGIDLTNGSPFPTDDGFTANDSKGHGAPNDPNNFQDFPVLTSATQLAGGTQVQGSLTEADRPNATFRLEFFASNPDPLGGIAEGQFFLGSTNVTTNASGHASFNVTLPARAGAGQVVTATATDTSAGNTSEFSPGVPLSGPPAPPSPTPVFTAGLVSLGGSRRNVSVDIVSSDTTALPHFAYVTWSDGKSDLVALAADGTAHVPHQFAGPQKHPQASVALLDASFATGTLLVPVNPAGAGSPLTAPGSPLLSALARQLRKSPRTVDLSFSLGGLSAVPHFAVIAWGDGTTSLVALGAGTGGSFDVRHRYAGGHKHGPILLFVLNPQRVSGTVTLPLGQTAGGSLAPLVPIAGASGAPTAATLPASGLHALTLGTVASGVTQLDGPIFPNIPLNDRPNLGGVYAFRSPADPQPPNPDAANFGNTVLAVTISPFAGVLTPNTFDPRMSVSLNVVNVQGHTNPDLSFVVTFGTPISNAPNPGSSQVVTVNLVQGNTTTTIATYTYNTTQTIPPAAFPNNVTFPGDAIATGKFIAGDFDNPEFQDTQGLANFLANPANGLPRPAPANPAKPLPTNAKDYYGPNSNILGFVLEVPTTKLTTANPPLIGVWADSLYNGTQVDRMGRPLIDGILIPPVPRTDLSRGQRETAFNLGNPATDVANFRADMIAVLTGPVYQRTLADATALVDSALGSTIVGPQTGLLPDILTVDLSKQYLAPGNGYFNGRRLRDDTTDIMLRVLDNNPAATDNVFEDNGNRITDGLFGTTPTFPYIGRPNNPADGPNP